jgi:hypothetical protein
MNRLFIEIVRLFLKFILGIENFLENKADISLKFFISIGSSVTSYQFFPIVDAGSSALESYPQIFHFWKFTSFVTSLQNLATPKVHMDTTYISPIYTSIYIYAYFYTHS